MSIAGWEPRPTGWTDTHTCHANVNVRGSENSANRDMTHADAIGEHASKITRMHILYACTHTTCKHIIDCLHMTDKRHKM